MIRALIIEDEILAINRLKRLLEKSVYDVQIVHQLGTISAVVDYLANHPSNLDLIFLDIHLSDGSSFSIFEQIEVQIPIIFTTAYDQYALQAFKQNSIDYLLKPIGQQELAASLSKFQKWFSQANTSQQSIDYQKLANSIQSSSAHYKQRFLVQTGAKIKTIDRAEIAYMYSEQGYTFLTTHEGQTYDWSDSLEKLTQQLPPDQFYRVNRKIIVQLNAIQEAYYFSPTRLKLNLVPPTAFDVFVPIDRLVAFKNWMGG
ncbi:MAG: LytTR family DNA-binding domain-containing protein [Bacteroidota bacterium]